MGPNSRRTMVQALAKIGTVGDAAALIEEYRRRPAETLGPTSRRCRR
jgi:hypothetical protein